MRSAALVLNVFAPSIAGFNCYCVGTFSWALFLPLGIASIPAAFIGGTLGLLSQIYMPTIGAVLSVFA